MKEKIFLLLFLGIFYIGYPQTPDEIQKIIQNYDLEYLNQLAEEALEKETEKRQYALQMAAINNWDITIENPDGTISQLMEVTEEGHPIYYTTTNVNAAISTRTNYLNTGGELNLGLDGSNMLVGVWDGGGVLTSHQEFGGRIILGDTPNTNNPLNNNHATHVTGTIIAEGYDALAKGMASVAKAKTYDWNGHLNEHITAGQNGMILSNHSYGERANSLPDWQFGAYTVTSQTWDNMMYYTPYHLLVFSAGNNGNTNYNASPMLAGYDKLTAFATCKNTLVVANAQDAVIDSQGNLISVNINTSSSEGPTDDLRIKPDITGNGTALYSCIAASNSSYAAYSGTSMAAPNVTGSLLLLQEYYNRLNSSYMRAATLKGLALHTADDFLDNGPDAVSGWGLLNSKKAAETITKKGAYSIISERTRYNGDTPYTFDVYSDGINPLQVSISWTDPVGSSQTSASDLNDSTPRLNSDLDVRVTKNGVTHYPYTLTSATTNTQSDNYRDPYERIDITLVEEGYYTVSITHKNNFGYNPQNYSLIVTGIVECTQVTDMIITNTINSGDTELENTLQTITASNLINTDANVIYRAGESVTLTEGFYASNGSNFLGEIGLCGNSYIPGTSGRPAIVTKDESSDVLINEINYKLNVYPNPVTEILNIEFTEDIASLSLYSIDGKEIINKEINSGSYQLNVSGLNSGIYILNVKTDSGEIFIDKIVVE